MAKKIKLYEPEKITPRTQNKSGDETDSRIVGLNLTYENRAALDELSKEKGAPTKTAFVRSLIPSLVEVSALQEHWLNLGCDGRFPTEELHRCFALALREEMMGKDTPYEISVQVIANMKESKNPTQYTFESYSIWSKAKRGVEGYTLRKVVIRNIQTWMAHKETGEKDFTDEIERMEDLMIAMKIGKDN